MFWLTGVLQVLNVRNALTMSGLFDERIWLIFMNVLNRIVFVDRIKGPDIVWEACSTCGFSLVY